MVYEGLHIIEFKDENIILLYGDSGAGKTTIFNAIYWCLYGSIKDIEPLETESEETYVCMEFNDIIIYRRRPREFKVTIHEGVFIDAAAEGIITRLFGDRELWRATSYIEQESHSILVEGTNKEKKAVLKSLSFTESNVKDRIETIEKELKEAESVLESNRNLTLHKIQAYNNLLGGVPFVPNTLFSDYTLVRPDLTYFCTTEKLNEMTCTYHSLYNTYNSLQQQQLNQSHNIGVRSTLQHQLSCSIQKVQNIPEEPVCIELLTQANLRLHEAESLLIWVNEQNLLHNDVQGLQTCISRLKIDTPSNLSFTDIEYNQALQTEFLYNKNLELCRSINIVYDKNITGEIQRTNQGIQLLAQLTSMLPDWLRVKDLEREFSIQPSQSYTIEDYNHAVELEKRVEYNRMICSKYNLPYEKEVIEAEVSRLTTLDDIYKNYKTEVLRLLEFTNSNSNSSNENLKNRDTTQHFHFTFEELQKLQNDAKDYHLRYLHNKSVLVSCELSEHLTGEQIHKYTVDVRSFLDTQEILRDKNKTRHVAFSILQNLQMKFEEVLPEKSRLIQLKADKTEQRNKLISDLCLLESSSNVLVCPNCSTNLQVIQNKLQLSDVSWVADLEKVDTETRVALSNVNQHLTQIEDRLKLIDKFLELNFTEFDIPEALTVEQCDRYKFILKQLEQLDYKCITPSEYDAEYYQSVCEQKARQFFLSRNIDIDLILNHKPNTVKLHELQGIYSYDQPTISAKDIYIYMKQENELNQLKELRSKTSGFSCLLAQYKELQNNPNVNENLLHSELNNLQAKCSILNRIELIELPTYSSNIIQKVIQLNKYEVELLTKTNRLQEIHTYVGGKSINTDISALRNEVLARGRDLEVRRAEDVMIKGLSDQISKLHIDDTLDERMKLTYAQLQNFYKIIEESKKAISFKTQHDELVNEINQMADLENYVIGLQRCKTEAPISESICLQYTVEKINKALDITLAPMFSQPITVKMVLAKELKTKKGKLKMGVNYEVSYNGKSYKTITQASVGERKRISLAILIAINMLSKSRIVLIDEAGACLDAKHRSNMIEALKQLKYMGKTVYCIDHETVAGFYDDYHQIKSNN